MGNDLSRLWQEIPNPNIRHLGQESWKLTAEQLAAYLRSVIEHLSSPKGFCCSFRMQNMDKSQDSLPTVTCQSVNSTQSPMNHSKKTAKGVQSPPPKMGSLDCKKPGALPGLLFPESTGSTLQILHKSGNLSAYLCLSSRPWPHIPFDYPGLCLIKGKNRDRADPRLTPEALGKTSDRVYVSQQKILERNGSFTITDGKRELVAPNLCESPDQTWFRGPIMILLSREHFWNSHPVPNLVFLPSPFKFSPLLWRAKQTQRKPPRSHDRSLDATVYSFLGIAQGYRLVLLKRSATERKCRWIGFTFWTIASC